MDDLSEWADMDKDMIKEICTACDRLDRKTLMLNAARNIIDSEKDTEEYLMIFAFNSYLFSGKEYLMSFASGSEKEHGQQYAQINYDHYIRRHEDMAVSDRFADPDDYCCVMNWLVSYFVDTVKEICAEGFPWDVVREMLFIPLKRHQFNRIAQKISREDHE